MAATGQLYSRFPFRPRAPAGNTFRPRPPGQRFFSPRNQLGNTAAFRQPGNTAAFRPRQPGAGYVQKFCSLCRDAGLPARVYQAHNLTECYRLNRSTVTQLRSLVLDDNLVPEDYQEHYNDTAAETDYNFPAETAYYEEQNHQQQWLYDSNPYSSNTDYQSPLNTHVDKQHITDLSLGYIKSEPSLVLTVFYADIPVHITLDGGATSNYIKLELCLRLGLKILPNYQTSTLGDRKTQMKS